MPTPHGLADLEAAYLAARDARDRLDIALARGLPADVTSLADAAATTERAVRAALAAFDADPPADASNEDARALAAIRAGIETAFEDDNELARSRRCPARTLRRRRRLGRGDRGRRAVLNARLEACYGALAEHLPVGDEVLTRRQILSRLAAEPDGDTRRRLFLGFAPLWRAVDADGDATGPGTRPSPYRAFIRECACPLGERRLTDRGQRAGARAGTGRDRAVGDRDARGVARRGFRPGSCKRRAADRALGLVVAAGEADRAMRDVLPLARVDGDQPTATSRPWASTSTRSTPPSTPRPGPTGRPSPSPTPRSGRGPPAAPTAPGRRAPRRSSGPTSTAASAS